MSEYIADDYIKFIETGRRDKLSPFGLGLIAKEHRRLKAEKAELIEFVKDIVDYEAGRVLNEREKLLNKYEPQ